MNLRSFWAVIVLALIGVVGVSTSHATTTNRAVTISHMRTVLPAEVASAPALSAPVAVETNLGIKNGTLLAMPVPACVPGLPGCTPPPAPKPCPVPPAPGGSLVGLLLHANDATKDRG